MPRVLAPFLVLLGLLTALFMFAEVLQASLPAQEPPGARNAADVPRMVVLMFDGADHRILSEYIAAGHCPNLARLAEAGGFRPLLSEVPPESPVALASMLCGVNPGRTEIFDFVMRGPRNQPINGMIDIKKARFLGRVPLRRPVVTSRLAYPTFSDRVYEAGFPILSLRQPLLFPVAERPGARMTSGLGTPDLAGSAGFYTYYSNRLRTEEGYTVFGGYRMPLAGGEEALVYDTRLLGPQDPTLGPNRYGGNQRASVPLRFERATEDGIAGVRIHLQGRSEFVAPKQRSGFFEVTFELNTAPIRKDIVGVLRFEVLSLEPLEVMADVVQQDPRDALFPISTPEALGEEHWQADGPFETTGWQEQTFALNDGVQDDAGFLRDVLQDVDRSEVMLLREMDRVHETHGVTPRLVFHAFTATDRAAHCFFRYRDPQHPLHDPKAQLIAQDPIRQVYARMDQTVGRVLDRLGPEDTLLVCSDHGFMTWRWAMHVNQWLADEGYLTLHADAETKTLGKFFTFAEGADAVDWTKTRAFAIGLGQIYINLRERDETGIVKPESKRALMEEIRTKLLALTNPYLSEEELAGGTAARPVHSVTILEDVYTFGPDGPPPHVPDLQIGFAEGYRISWQTALLGGMARHGETFERNRLAWSGDHCSTDRALVPGILLSNRPIDDPAHGVQYTVRDICATVLEHFGIDRAVLHGESQPIRLGR